MPSSLSSWSFNIGKGRCYLSLNLWDTGAGLQGLLVGGEKPHIGGVVLAVPRTSLTGEGMSCDLYITPVPHHKDIELARPLADRLARLIHQPVVITAGVHSDNLAHDELEEIWENYRKMTNNIIESFKDRPSEN